MSPARSSQKAITPTSVKWLMLIEAGIVGFLAYWVLSEYAYNAFFRTYIDQALLSHVTTYTIAIGLGIGLAGSAVTATLYANLRRTKRRLEAVAGPRIRGAVDKILSSLPTLDEHPTSTLSRSAATSQVSDTLQPSPVTSIVPVLTDSKKESI